MLTSALRRASALAAANARAMQPVVASGVWQQTAARPVAVRCLAAAAEAAASGNKHVNMTVSQDGIAVVRLNSVGEPVNALGMGLMGEFDKIMTEIENNKAIKAVVLISDKPNCFVAGADISMLASCTTAQQLQEVSRAGQKMMERIERSHAPFVAAINGSCMGGGLELALACKYRIASTNPKTALSVPEVKLGLLPGAGGTQRLPRTVGIQAALDMMLTGKNIRADRARKMGLVHTVADPYALEPAAMQAARDLARGQSVPGLKKGLMAKLLEDNPIGRSVLFKQAGEMVAKQAGSNYPAPFAILDCVRTGASSGAAAGYAKEAEEFGKLGGTSVSKSLISIFFGQRQCTKNPFGKPAKPAKNLTVFGAGLMGAGIAQVSVEKGFNVVLKDRDAKGIARGEKQIFDNLSGNVKKRSMTAFDRDLLCSKVLGLTDDMPSWPAHVGRSDIVIEAVFEDLGLKHRLVQQIEPMLRDDAVFATNTSALPIASIASVAKHPERVIGMHYFSPVDKMPLLEIIRHDGTSDAAAAVAVDVGLRQGKTVIVVKDVPGFYVNRCLGPFMVESIALLNEGVAPEALDKALKKFGFPVGPITLADEVGIDVATHVATFLGDKLQNRMQGANPETMKAMVAAGLLGRKTGKGFFVYGADKKAKKVLNSDAVAILNKFKTSDKGASLPESDMQNRMVLRFMNEAFFCLQDDIIRNPTDGDIGAVFGMGFPPFLGGPFRYADSLGLQKVVDMMNRYADTVGPQFAPAPIVVDRAKAGKTFHSS